MSPARRAAGLVAAAGAHVAAAGDAPAPSGVRLAVVSGGALLLVVGLVVVLVLLVRRRRRPAAPPAYRGASPLDPARRTALAWQPDPPPGMPPGTVPRQPQTGPRRR
jgi:hypothetical protein